MQLGRRLLLFLRSLNPDTYPKLCEEIRLGEAWLQFFFTFGLLFLVMLFLFVPSVLVGAPRLVASLQAFDTLSFDGEAQAQAPITILHDPLVAVDFAENRTLEDETLLFTDRGVEWRTWYFFGRSERTWDELRDAKAYADDAYLALLLFLVPSLAFWLGALLLVKALLLLFLAVPLAYLVPRLWKLKLSFGDATKIGLFSATIMLLLEMTLFPFVRIFWLPAGLYFLFVALGAALVGERVLEHEHPVKRKHRDFE